MELTNTHKIIISIVAVIVLLLIYIAFDKRAKDNVASTDIETNQNATTTTVGTVNGTPVNIQGNGNYTIEQVPLNEGVSLPQPIPNLDRSVTVSAGAMIAPEAKSVAAEKVKSMQVLLKQNAANLAAWIDLGIYQKMGGDYEGALISWKYAGRLAPTDFVSVANIGNLYAYYLKDNAQAEIYYKKAISNGPTQVYLYTQFAEIYRDIFKDINKARSIINQGLSKIPNDQSLIQFQKSLE